MATNSETDTIYELNPDDCTTLATLAPPQGGSYQGAGLELDTDGDLWVVAQSPNQVYLMARGRFDVPVLPWLAAEPTQGSVQPGAELAIAVAFDTTGLEPGLYLGTMVVNTTAARQPSIRVPISLVVSGYLRGINCGGSDYVDSLEDLWDADRAYRSGEYGYVQQGITRSTTQAISGTEDEVLYQSQRENAYAYRFDNVPNGTYQLDRFQVEVTDGQLDVRLVSRSRKAPVIDAIRVAHRPDL